MQVDFYHLTAAPLDRVLPKIAEKVIDAGGRLLIVSGQDVQRAAIDKLLWTYTPESFLPHAQAGAGKDAAQPVLIADEAVAGNAARNIAIVDGVWRDEALGFDRAFHFFEEGSVEPARAAWKSLAKREGIEPRYWKQDDDGRWFQAA
jgi:DNA polymerase-3 subunit chi